MAARLSIHVGMRTILAVIALVSACLTVWTMEPGETVLRRTHRELDLAIVGHGYFQLADVETPAIHFTRIGRFGINGNNMLTHHSGRQIEPAISIPDRFLSIRVSDEGGVFVRMPGSHEEEQRGQLQLARYVNEAGLVSVGRDCFAQTEASGVPVTANPMHAGMGVLQQGWLEGKPSWRERWIAGLPLALIVLSVASLLWSWTKVIASPSTS